MTTSPILAAQLAALHLADLRRFRTVRGARTDARTEARTEARRAWR